MYAYQSIFSWCSAQHITYYCFTFPDGSTLAAAEQRETRDTIEDVLEGEEIEEEEDEDDGQVWFDSKI